MPEATSRPRHAWMDTLRGVAVFLVIFSHSTVLVPVGAPFPLVVVDRALAPFRVPALMFLSGMLLSASLAKPRPVYLRGKISRIAWPYLVWSGIILFLSSFGKPSTSPLVELFVRPTTPMWYVGYLFLFYLLVMFTTPAVRTWLLLPVLAAAVLLDPVQGLAPSPAVIGGLRTRFFSTFFCFLAGDLFARHQARWLPFLTRRVVTVACIVLAVPAAVLAVLDFAVQYQPMYLPCVLAAFIAAVPGLTRLAPTAVGAFFAAQGRRSIVFYVSHYPAQVIAWHAVQATGVQNGYVYVAVNVVAGLSAGFVLGWLRLRVPLVDYLFDLHLERFAGRRSSQRGRPRPSRSEVSGSTRAPAAEV